jgi:hypothetical protein
MELAMAPSVGSLAQMAAAAEGDDRAATLGYFEDNPFIFYLLLIVLLYIVLQSLLFLILKRKGKRGRYEGPDYIQFRRRI